MCLLKEIFESSQWIAASAIELPWLWHDNVSRFWQMHSKHIVGTILFQVFPEIKEFIYLIYDPAACEIAGTLQFQAGGAVDQVFQG